MARGGKSGPRPWPDLLSHVRLVIVLVALLFLYSRACELEISTQVGPNGTTILTCLGCTNHTHVSLIYWIVNESFPEQLDSSLSEGRTHKHKFPNQSLTEISTNLTVGPDVATHSTNFSCVLVDPEQVVQRHLALTPPGTTPPTATRTPPENADAAGARRRRRGAPTSPGAPTPPGAPTSPGAPTLPGAPKVVGTPPPKGNKKNKKKGKGKKRRGNKTKHKNDKKRGGIPKNRHVR
ncbi:MC054L [Molluscum contagiosum virus subtype 1]|uniref:MC054L n=2 Tax=Molluscum contagiosum virus TaxID=10279 RepID=Q98222_MCV1|nr:MC054L [Molluscum contagiosum virus subtype 1]AZT86276.1 MC054L [Molluscum contagiosum virus]AAC55182.1 MC054L [Molluscum contagiosum virus subtype 1]AQY16803.1 MC054 [Molluscum contagiosum virus subtype 1]AYO88726.1 MC054 [Molluscum contagiosum virus subtype 1]QHW16795.1 MC054L [Molluscum contagiosum virus]